MRMLIRVFGVTTGELRRWVSEQTVAKVQEKMKNCADIVFVNMDTPDGFKEACNEYIQFIPTIICEYGSAMYMLENRSSLKDGENDFHKNLAGKWWTDLDVFINKLYDIVSKYPI